ncbi:MAG: D-erythro-7,8-dihydroneopterin triphosphate epimerase [Candidatus Heimdallarchaeota archaeon LC_2]|nr:MAG: D-erythro-7,8-dihydroneopterin triphosphate epimerase [Candidatus Heimdallarchaeota archaeon LC_2]
MLNKDTIFIKNLKVRGIIGINDWERKEKQDILINVSLVLNLEKAGKSDNIDDTVNYRTLTKEIIDLVEISQFFLVEKLISTILDLCLKQDIVEKAKVRVEKPMALRFAESVGVEIERSKL